MGRDPTGVGRTFGEEEIIVSKTNLHGAISYANDVFLRVSGFRESEVIGQPHSIVRHPDMPRSIFAAMWATLMQGREMFAYVKNMAKNGDHYWVLAHVTPTTDSVGNITGFHSNRRWPEPRSVGRATELYNLLLREERRHSSKANQVAAGLAELERALAAQGITYDEFVFSI